VSEGEQALGQVRADEAGTSSDQAKGGRRCGDVVEGHDRAIYASAAGYFPIMIVRFSRAARKLRGRTMREFRERGAQAFAAWRERTGLARDAFTVDDAALARRLASGTPADPSARLAAFRMRPPRFMPVFDDPAATVAALAARCPDNRADVVARADRILGRQFDVLGYRGLSYGDPVDWHRDPVHNRRAPGDRHWSRVPYLDAEAVGDHKVTWEVNRQQYLVTLGQAYWYTGDERYARGFAEHVGAWMDANPPKRGINWASSLEVAFRAMSWVWALHFFRQSPALTPALYTRLLGFLDVHAAHLERYLSTYFSPNTHLTGEALGLVHVGALVPELAAADRWCQRGLDVLREWIPRQVRPDGGYFEQATQYHRYTTEFTLHLLVLDRRRGWGLDSTLRPLLAGLLDYVAAITRPDGTIPLLGDDDGGKLVVLDPRPPDDVRGVLAQGAVWLDAPALARVGGPSDSHASALWLLGPDSGARLDALAAAPAPPARRSRAFQDTGVFVLRDGDGPDALHALFDCGPHGVLNFGHAHADVLALTASAGGRHLLVDSGTFSYPGPERNAFRGGASHNVLLVDGEASSAPAAGAFQWERVAHGRLLAWEADAHSTYVEGTHDGFAHLPDPVAHRRSVLMLPGLGWVVRDRVQARAAHRVRLHWHLAPGLAPAHGADGGSTRVVNEAGRVALVLAAFGGGGPLPLSAEPAWVSPRYGARVRSTRLVAEHASFGPQDVVTFVIPASGVGCDARVEPVRATGSARAFVVRAGAGVGLASALVIVGGGGPWEVVDALVGRAGAAPEPPLTGSADLAWVARGREAAWHAGAVQGDRRMRSGAAVDALARLAARLERDASGPAHA
jgi:hypothetical protein